MNKQARQCLGPVVAGLLGMGLTTAWFQSTTRRETSLSEKANQAALEAADSKAQGQITLVNSSGQPPWKKAGSEEQAPGLEPDLETTVDPFGINTAYEVEFRHAERMDNLALTLLLGLTSAQTEALANRTLVEYIDPFDGPGQIVLSDILTPAQAEIYQRRKERLERNRAESYALTWVHRLARAIDLSDEQREKLFKLGAERCATGIRRQLDPFGGLDPLGEFKKSESDDSRDFGAELFEISVREILSEDQYQAYEELNRRPVEIYETYMKEAGIERRSPFIPDDP
jgi:hypothetical protein